LRDRFAIGTGIGARKVHISQKPWLRSCEGVAQKNGEPDSAPRKVLLLHAILRSQDQRAWNAP
jgi:hypothetical protein